MPTRRQCKCILVIVVTSSSLGIVDVIVVIVVIVVIAIGGIIVVVIAATIRSLTRSGNHNRLSQTAINGNQRLPRGVSVIYFTLFQFNFILSSRFFGACSYCVNTGNWLARRRWQTHIKPDLNLRISLCNRHPAVCTALAVVLLLLTLRAGTANR